jgi:hypothetical protein
MLSDPLYRLRALFRWRAADRDLEDELRFHLDSETDARISRGADSAEAARQARIAFGGVEQTREACREARGVSLLPAIARDLRFAVRILLGTPGFTAVAILTLALGIGANTVVFSVIERFVLRPLDYSNPDNLVSLTWRVPSLHLDNLKPAPANYFTEREQTRTLVDVGLYLWNSADVTGFGQPEHVRMLDVTYATLPLLGVKPALGRLFTREEDSPNGPKTVIISFGYWQRNLGGNRQVLGRALTLDGVPYEIVGVLPRSFHFLDSHPDIDLYTTLQLNPGTTKLGDFKYQSIARLRPGVTLPQVNAEMDHLLPVTLHTFPPTDEISLNVWEKLEMHGHAHALKEDVLGDVGKTLWVVMGSMGVLLLVACSNVANLLLVRVEGRRQELAVFRARCGARTNCVKAARREHSAQY